MVPSLFEYPPAHQRKHAPRGYRGYQSYKDYLRDDFIFRCVYCLERERWYPSGHAAFSADHVKCQVDNPEEVTNYDNLVYACVRCNSARRHAKLIDPTQQSLADHIQVQADATLIPLTVEGQDLIDTLDLNELKAIETRQYYLRLFELKQEFPNSAKLHANYVNAFGYPSDLPNLLDKRPPGGNERAENEQNCFHALRERHELGEIY